MDEQAVRHWRGRIEQARRKRGDYEKVWKENVAFRKMKPFESESEHDRVATPDDWTRTRAKAAALFSAVPTIQTAPLHPRYAAAAPVMAKVINHVLKHQAKPHVVMRECMPDLINAAGICAAIVRYEATFEKVEVPAVDVSTLPPAQQLGAIMTGNVPMEPVDVPVCERFVMRRISPTQLLWPAEFTGSDFNDADWIGYEGIYPWAVAKREFNLKDEDKAKIAGAAKKPETLSSDENKDQPGDADPSVTFQEIYYWAHRYDANEKYLDKIRRVVFVDGLDHAPVDEDYKGQRFDPETREYIGVRIFPIQVCTIAYVSDEAVPPSDSEIGRPAVLERMRSRSQIIAQRRLSLPLRWADTSRLDPATLEKLQRGDWQDLILLQGSGERAIGEVARASYPHEDFSFDGIISRDLDDAWSLSHNQLGVYNTGARSATEAQVIAVANAERIGYERAQVVNFFLALVEVLAGLLQLYFDASDMEPIVGPDGVQNIESWDRSKIAGKFVFSITQDSTVLLDSNAKIDKLMKALNLVGKSGYVNPEPIIAEILSLSGIDPAQVMVKPEPPKPEQPNISLRLTGGEDLQNPMALAMLIKSGQAPDPALLEQAKQLILAAALAPQAPAGPPLDMTQQQTDASGASVAPADDWGPAERVTKRVEEIGG